MSTEQDPHKHALYRPHMGDMTGWRFIEFGDTRTAGDEYMWRDDETGKWRLISTNIGELYTGYQVSELVYRRRITPESKPEEAKRFVTVVYEVKFPEFTLPPCYPLLGLQQISHHEGNYLEKFDQIKEITK